ncbi:hypothetical protein PCE1_004612 [Barthelona sp. PCE]
MRTHRDILNQLKYDPVFNASAFEMNNETGETTNTAVENANITIGYADRFKGIKEEAEINPDVPAHRILYIKLKGTIIWSRLSKLDRLKEADITFKRFSHISNVYKLQARSCIPLQTGTSIVQVSVCSNTLLLLTEDGDVLVEGRFTLNGEENRVQTISSLLEIINLPDMDVVSIAASDSMICICSTYSLVYFTSLHSLKTITTEKPIAKVVCGINHGALLFCDGSIQMFGSNTQGQLGTHLLDDMPREERYSSELVSPNVFGTFLDVACTDHSTILLMNDWRVLVFGSNKHSITCVDVDQSSSSEPFLMNHTFPNCMRFFAHGETVCAISDCGYCHLWGRRDHISVEDLRDAPTLLNEKNQHIVNASWENSNHVELLSKVAGEANTHFIHKAEELKCRENISFNKTFFFNNRKYAIERAFDTPHRVLNNPSFAFFEHFLLDAVQNRCDDMLFASLFTDEEKTLFFDMENAKQRLVLGALIFGVYLDSELDVIDLETACMPFGLGRKNFFRIRKILSKANPTYPFVVSPPCEIELPLDIMLIDEDEGEHPVNRDILLSLSQLASAFAAFGDDSHRIELDFPAATVSDIATLINTRNCDHLNIDIDEAPNYLRISEYLCAQPLTEFIVERIAQTITPLTFVETFMLAIHLDNTSLLERCLEWTHNNAGSAWSIEHFYYERKHQSLFFHLSQENSIQFIQRMVQAGCSLPVSCHDIFNQ